MISDRGGFWAASMVIVGLSIAAGCGGSDAGSPRRSGSGTAGAGSIPTLGAAGTTAGLGSTGVGTRTGGVQAGAPALGTAGVGAAVTAGTTTTAPVAGMTGVMLGSAGVSAAAVGAGAAGATGGSAGTPATTPMGGGTDTSGCPPAPDGASPEAVKALAAVNAVRVAAGSGCITEVLALNTSAQKHCDYVTMYQLGDMCIADPHTEVMGCNGFYAASLFSSGFGGNGTPGRASLAGYMGFASSEVIAFSNDPQSAVDQWVNSVWHRTPILDPFTGDMGYGNAPHCDTIDFGRGMPSAANDTVVVYPYDGQTDVPTTFDGSREGPMPPAPSTGWPSSSPISVQAMGIKITDHVLTLDGDSTPIEHVWLDAASTPSMSQYLTNIVFLYANKPFAANTKYHVHVTGTSAGGAVNLEWTFTTGASNGFGWP